jgi:ABC-type phosphate transport system auxiliary subunit
MSAHAITLELPGPLYEHFKRRVERTHRSLEAELLDAVANAASVEGDEISPELTEALEDMTNLDDRELWQIARRTMSPTASRQLEALHFKQRDEGLDGDEDADRRKLIRQYERTMLMRAQAARLLKERGHDVSGLVAAK